MCHVLLFYSPNLSAVKTEGLLAPLASHHISYRPLSKVRCCRRKNSGDYRRDCHTNPSKNRTIPLAFRRMSVCVCLVGFASLQSTWAHTLRHPCLACSSRCTEYCHSHNNCKKTIIPQKSPSHLPPLSKVRCCRRKNSGDYRRDCHTNPRPAPTLPKTAPSLRLALYPCLPSKKGRWIDGKAQTVALLRFNCISTPFLSPNLFAVKTEGLLHPLAPHQPFQTRTIPFAFRVASSTAPFTTKIKSAPVFTGANSSSH